MPSSRFAVQLARYGPQRQALKQPPLREAQAYCRNLARTHYENFTVASWLLPRALRQHFYHVYAYCRWADDLADEIDDPQRSLTLLEWWETLLVDCYRGRARHPVFVALAETIEALDIPAEPFLDLLTAFRQDQRRRRYETFEHLLGYCGKSANPVGRLVLYLGRCHNQQTVALSDRICTGLQLANFCQDVARDFDRGRIYVPQESRHRFGCDEATFERRECNEAFRRLMAFEVQRAETYLKSGLPLLDHVPRHLLVPVDLFVQGGLLTVEKIRRLDFDVWTRRPTVGKFDKLGLLIRAWWRGRRVGAGGSYG